MRKIKFRAWHPRSKDMVFFDNKKAANDAYIAHHFFTLMANEHELGADLLMQLTGAFDSNSNEIYEGDICYVKGLGNCRVGICHFYGVIFYSSDGQECPLIDCMAENDSFNVIGNIHANPELMECK